MKLPAKRSALNFKMIKGFHDGRRALPPAAVYLRLVRRFNVDPTNLQWNRS